MELVTIWGDYHTHTFYSGKNGHSTCSAADIYAAAKEKGLKEVAICDHGVRHCCFGTTRARLKKLRAELDELNARGDVKMLLGIEANIYSSDGLIDVKQEERGAFDIVVAGYHKLVWGKNMVDAMRYNIPALLGVDTESAKKRYTRAVVNAIKTQKIDVLSHPCYGLPTDMREIVKAAEDYGVMLELNGKRISMSDEDVLFMAASKVKIVANSDAHSRERVGDVAVPIDLCKRLGIPFDRIENFKGLLTVKELNGKDNHYEKN